ncbi:hypothetical protein C8R45DRAFT_1091855 [Mycena sanguinolenta]|nr:hypothetical protein C8R45DRAFT_1091855 [Mycena sanguinolenta]
MVWPEFILDEFATVPEGNDVNEKEFHGPYNKLLYTLSPPTANTPLYPSPRVHLGAEATRGSEVSVDAHGCGRPDSAPPRGSCTQVHRSATRRRFNLINPDAAETPLPVLYAVSAIGTKLSFYTHTKGRKDPILPAGIPYDRIRVNDVAPREWWALDILEDGEQRLRTVIDEIKASCANL